MIFEINESGGAHQKYVQLMSKKADDANKDLERIAYRSKAAAATGNHKKIKEYSDKINEKLDKASDYEAEASKYDNDKYSKRYINHIKNGDYENAMRNLSYAKRNKEDFKNKFHSKGEDRLANKKSGIVLQGQKEINSLKEACETILSALEDM